MTCLTVTVGFPSLLSPFPGTTFSKLARINSRLLVLRLGLSLVRLFAYYAHYGWFKLACCLQSPLEVLTLEILGSANP
jgi:hypothetical protein